MSSLHSRAAFPPPWAKALSLETSSHPSFDPSSSYASTVVIPSAVNTAVGGKVGSPAQDIDSTPEEYNIALAIAYKNIKIEYIATAKVMKRKIRLRTYRANRGEREALEAVGAHLKELYWKYDRQWYYYTQSLKVSALRLIKIKELPKDISHESARELEKVRNEAWFTILEKLETEEHALVQWMEDVVEAGAQQQAEPPKPVHAFTNLFMAAANDCKLSFADARFAIEQYVRFCKPCPVIPEVGNTAILHVADIVDSLEIDELAKTIAIMQEWLKKWHGVGDYFWE